MTDRLPNSTVWAGRNSVPALFHSVLCVFTLKHYAIDPGPTKIFFLYLNVHTSKLSHSNLFYS